MGRPSKLSDAQVEEIKRRLASGEGLRALAREFGVSPGNLSTRVSKRAEQVKSVANQIVATEEALKALTVPEQRSAIRIAEGLTRLSESLLAAANYSASTAQRMAALANSEVQKIDDAEPLKSVETVRTVAVFTKLANDSASIGLNLLTANRETVKEMNRSAGVSSVGGVGQLDAMTREDFREEAAKLVRDV